MVSYHHTDACCNIASELACCPAQPQTFSVTDATRLLCRSQPYTRICYRSFCTFSIILPEHHSKLTTARINTYAKDFREVGKIQHMSADERSSESYEYGFCLLGPLQLCRAMLGWPGNVSLAPGDGTMDVVNLPEISRLRKGRRQTVAAVRFAMTSELWMCVRFMMIGDAKCSAPGCRVNRQRRRLAETMCVACRVVLYRSTMQLLTGNACIATV